MSMRRLTAYLIVSIGLFSCEKDPGQISVINKLPGAELKNVKWGDLLIDNQLLPGEQSQVIKIREDDFRADLPESHSISFQMTVNSSTVFLKTIEIFLLDLEESIMIEIDTTTEVQNPLINP